MISGIYEIRNKLTSDFYIGSSCNLTHRLSEHRRMLVKNKHHSQYLQAAWNKYGDKNFIFRVVVLSPKEKLLSYEQILLDNLNPPYNMAKDALSPMKGRKQSQKQKEETGNRFRGKILSKVHKTRISLGKKGNNGLLGKTRSEESKEKIRQTLLGHKVEKSTREKVRNALKGRPNNNLAKTYYFKSPLGEIVTIFNMSEFCRKNCLGQSLMTMVANGKRNQHKGWKAL